MRIARLRLEHYRGIERVELDFPRGGVTVVEGPNEAGKSSLVEALRILFEEFDNTSKKAVKAVQPVGRDVGPEIEIEATTGPYAFRYRKRFLRRPETELEVSVPAAEKHTGREAHDRALEILRETIDTDLWHALRMLQGDAIEQARLKSTRDLARALTERTGVEDPPEEGDSLYERVFAEYTRWFTPKGRRLRSFDQLLEAEERAAARADGLAEELASLEADVQRSDEVAAEIADLETRAVEDRETAKRRRAEHDALQKSRDRVRLLEMQHRGAATQEAVARKETQDRRVLADRAGKERARCDELEQSVAKQRPVIERARAEEAAAREELTRAASERATARAAFEVRDRDMKFRDAELQLQQLDERRERITRALEQAAEAAAFLESNRVTAELVAALQQQEEALVRAQAQLDAGAPRVTVRAERRVDAEWDGDALPIEPGEPLERHVSERATLRVPGALEVSIEAGTSLETLVRARDEAAGARDALLERAGVADLDAARAALRRAEQGAARVEECEARVRENRRDLTLEQLDEKRARLRALVERYPPERPAEPPMAPDFESAAAAKGAAQEAVEEAERAWQQAQARAESAAARLAEVRREEHGAGVALRLAREAREGAERELAAVRAERSDEDLAAALRAAREAAQEAERAYAAERRTLDEAQPDRVEELARNAELAAERTAARLREARDERLRLQSRLETLGERGLFDAVEDAREEHARAQRAAHAARRRAAAAELLFTTMREQQEQARTAYAGPLRERIEDLARYVFEGPFGIELDGDLTIATVVRDGTPLPLDHLSVGTQEQLALIQRVAVAMLIAGEGGVPLLFDDTLGHSDPQRLEGLGAMLSHAGQHCQVIVLTCTPDRFRHIGAARTIRLP